MKASGSNTSNQAKTEHQQSENSLGYFSHHPNFEIGESSNNPQPISSSPSPTQSPPRNAKVCKTCGKTFSNSQALGGHQNAHKLEREMQPAMTAQHNPFGCHEPMTRISGLVQRSHYGHHSRYSPYQGYSPRGCHIRPVYSNPRMGLVQSSPTPNLGLVQCQPTLAQSHVQHQPRLVQGLAQGRPGVSQGLVYNQPNIAQGFVHGQPSHAQDLTYRQLSHGQGLVHGQPGHVQGLVIGRPSHARGLVMGRPRNAQGLVLGRPIHVQGLIHNQPDLAQGFVHVQQLQLSQTHNLVHIQPSHAHGLVHEQLRNPQGLSHGQPSNIHGLVHGQPSQPQGVVHLLLSQTRETVYSQLNISRGPEGFIGNSSINSASLTYNRGRQTPYIGPSGIVRADDYTNCNSFAAPNLANHTHVNENEGNLATGSTSCSLSFNGSQTEQVNIHATPNESTMLDLNLKL